MSVQRIPVHVMKMLIVPTVTVLIAVLANKDSLEMEQYVTVCKRTSLKYATRIPSRNETCSI